jgi:O-antigen ligase
VKWAALAFFLTIIAPMSGWLRRNPREAPKLWMLLGFLPFGPPFHSYMALVSWQWVGYVKGAEISLLDFLALVIYFSLPSTRDPLPFRFSMLFYFVAVLLSAFQAEFPMAALFYPWQLARMFLVYAVVTRGCAADPRVAPAVLKGMAAGICFEAGLTIWQRFGLGVLQTSGTFIHQNLLGLVSHFVVFPFFALLLARRRGWLPTAVVLAGATVEVLTTSRATLGLAGFAFGAVFILSALRQWTSRKAWILLVGLAMIGVLGPLAVWSLEHRFATEGSSIDEDGGYDEREAYKRVAMMMLSDHPLGIGANHYTLIGNIEGYNVKAGVALVYSSLAGNVHNVYYLIAAETGYLGLISFVVLLFRSLTVAFLCGWRYRGDERGDLLLGLGVALLTVYLHSYVEWIFITFYAQYIYAINLGLVAGLAQQLGYWRRSPQGVRTGVGTLSIRPTGEGALGPVARPSSPLRR